jgi:hypothetical protein
MNGKGVQNDDEIRRIQNEGCHVGLRIQCEHPSKEILGDDGEGKVNLVTHLV